MTPDARDAGSTGWTRRIGWLILIWFASVFALGVIAAAVRVVMAWVGLTR
jgi:hypothetical protein